MGILVVGAERVDEWVEQLKRKFLTMKEKAKVSVDPHMRSSWKITKHYLGANGIDLSPI